MVGLWEAGFAGMALNAQSTCTSQVSNVMRVGDAKLSSSAGATGGAGGILPLAVKPKFQSSQLRRTKSRKPVKSGKLTPSATAVQEAAPAAAARSDVNSEVAVLSSQIGEEIATTSGNILDAVDSVMEDGTAAMGIRRGGGKANSSRTSRRRALVMCLALGVVRPCATNVASSLPQNDLRRTSSATIRRTSSASFKVPSSNLISQVSLASAMKQTNLLGDREDLQKLTTLQ